MMILALCIVSNVGATNPKDNVFCDIGGVVGHAFQVTSHDQRVEQISVIVG